MRRSHRSHPFRVFSVFVGLLCAAPSAHAVGLELFDVGAFVGARFGGDLSLPALQTNLSFDPAVSFGAMADVNVYDVGDANVFVSLLYGYQKTEVKQTTPTVRDEFLDDITGMYYHGGIGFQWKLVRWRPYVVGTLGWTHLSTDTVSGSSTDFSYAFGGGLKYQFLLNLGARVDVRWTGTRLDLGNTDWICGRFTCFEAQNDQTLWQTDTTFGLYGSF